MSRKCPRMRPLVFALMFVLSMSLAGAAEKPRVVATFSILGDLVKTVGGDRVSVDVLVGPNGDVHSFEPSPTESILLAQAQVIFENGLHLEPWLDKLCASSDTKAQRVVVSSDVETLLAPGGKGDADPHIWHDVANVMVAVEHIRDALVRIDPANAGYYKENAEKYLEELGELNHWIIDTLKDIPDERRKLVTSHDTFGYFAKRYGFSVIGTAVRSAAAEAVDPSAGELARLVDDIKKAGVRVAFIENTHNPKLMEAVAKEAGIKTAPRLYTDALGSPDSDGNTYINMIKHNVNIMANALAGAEAL